MKKLNYKKFIIVLNIFLISIFIFSLGTTFSYLGSLYTGNILRGSLNLTSGRVTQIIPYVENELKINVTTDNFVQGGYNLQTESQAGLKLMASEGEYLNISYNLYLNITYNDLEYTSYYNDPELILAIKGEDGRYLEYIDDPNYSGRLEEDYFDEYIDSNGNVYYSDYVSYIDVTETTGQILLIEGENLQAGSFDELVESYYTVELLLLNLDSNQILNEGKTFEAELIVEIVDNTSVVNYLSEMIIDSNGGTDYINNLYYDKENIYADMYAGEDELGTSYFLTYNENHKYVSFAGFFWEILRINGDGSIRMIYRGTELTDSRTGFNFSDSANIGQSTFNSIKTSESVGYMYEIGNQHGYEESSEVKNIIDEWYERYLVGNSDLIADAIYCNDRTILKKTPETELWYENTPINKDEPLNLLFYANKGSDLNLTYNATSRVFNNVTDLEPTYFCENKNDAFTVDDEVNGNGALKYPIGLITADEFELSGSELLTRTGWWTMTPGYTLDNYNFVVAPKISMIYLLNLTGSLEQYTIPTIYTTSIADIIPVISLKADVQVTGYGRYDDPFVVMGRG